MRLFSALLLACSLLCLTACKAGKVGVVDLNQVMTQSIQAKNAQKELVEVQKIYQYNLNVIENKLARYKNKAVAQNYFKQAAAQLQQQLQTSHAGINQALVNKLSEIIEGQTEKYSIIVNKNAIWTSDTANPADITEKVLVEFNDAVIQYPARPVKIDNPELPADAEAKK